MKAPEVFSRLEVYVDGGFERGGDILKAIALGATAVGVGRPFLYSLLYGQEGSAHLIQSRFSMVSTSDSANIALVLKDEIENSMRLCGLTDLDQASPDLLNISDIEHLIRRDDKFPKLPQAFITSKL